MTVANEIQRRVLENIEGLPPMPQTVVDIMQMSRGEDFSAAELAKVVCRDPTLATRVLKLCNSGSYALREEVSSVQRAVLLLGSEMVQNLVFSTFVRSVQNDDAEGYAQSADSLWEHSFGAATACMVLAGEVTPELVDRAYTAGLVHDIGKVALATLVAERFQEVLARVNSGGQCFVDAEREVLGTSHADVGALVAERWNLSEGLVDVIRHHHRPQDAKVDPQLGAMVSVADGICSILGIGAGLDATDCTLDPWSMDLLGLEGEKLQKVMDLVTQRLFSLDNQAI